MFQLGKTYLYLIFSIQAPNMTSNIMLPLSLLAHSIFACLWNLEAAIETAIEAAQLKNGGTIPHKVLKTPHIPGL